MQEVYCGVKINRFNESFPVGKIRMEHMYPMNFEEFLCIGAMPESVKNFMENDSDILKYDANILSNIIEMYIADMNKYVKNSI